uniref:DNA-directed RNA polymerase III subunit RPC4 n=1 Tax=Cacopsylla melanoneura TaxID=428564 RepID=A0A8D8XAU7_9HEMI
MSDKSNGPQAGPSSSSSTVQRLPTWKPPRDLSLASLSNNLKPSATPAAKKTFVPNLNIQRKKNAEPTPAAKNKKEVTANAKNDKPKFTGKKKDAKGLIQTTSVFSEGIAASEKKKQSWTSYREATESKANLAPPKLNLERNHQVDKTVDEKTLASLLRDDFIDDSYLDEDIKPDVKAPVQLPLVKQEPMEEKKKIAGGDMNLMAEWSSMLMKSEEGEENGEEGVKGTRFMFFQFPDSLAVSCTTPDNKETACYSMKEMSSGRIGTIQIMKSGKVRLVQGDKTYVIAQSINTSFHQDVLSVYTDSESKTGTLASLGPVSTRFLITPDWNTL